MAKLCFSSLCTEGCRKSLGEKWREKSEKTEKPSFANDEKLSDKSNIADVKRHEYREETRVRIEWGGRGGEGMNGKKSAAYRKLYVPHNGYDLYHKIGLRLEGERNYIFFFTLSHSCWYFFLARFLPRFVCHFASKMYSLTCLYFPPFCLSKLFFISVHTKKFFLQFFWQFSNFGTILRKSFLFENYFVALMFLSSKSFNFFQADANLFVD